MSVQSVDSNLLFPEPSTKQLESQRAEKIAAFAKKIIFGIGVAATVASIIGIWTVPFDLVAFWGAKELIAIPASLVPLPIVLIILKIADYIFNNRLEAARETSKQIKREEVFRFLDAKNNLDFGMVKKYRGELLDKDYISLLMKLMKNGRLPNKEISREIKSVPLFHREYSQFLLNKSKKESWMNAFVSYTNKRNPLSLDLSNTDNSSLSNLRKLLRKLPEVTIINLNAKGFDEEVLETIVELKPNLTSLTISSCEKFSKEDFKKLTLLKELTNLTLSGATHLETEDFASFKDRGLSVQKEGDVITIYPTPIECTDTTTSDSFYDDQLFLDSDFGGSSGGGGGGGGGGGLHFEFRER